MADTGAVRQRRYISRLKDGAKGVEELKQRIAELEAEAVELRSVCVPLSDLGARFRATAVILMFPNGGQS